MRDYPLSVPWGDAPSSSCAATARHMEDRLSQDQSQLSTTSSLIRELQAESPERWRTFVRLYSPLLRFWLGKEKAPPGHRDDILQECLASIVSSVSQFDRVDGGSFRGWLRTIVRRRVADFHRHRPPEVPAAPGMIENIAVAEPKLAEEFESEEQALADLRARALELVRQTVDPRTWEMFWEFAVETRPASEVAKKFGVSDAGVRMAAGRIRKRLRDLMIDGE